MPTGTAKLRFVNRAVPDLVASFALADKEATGRAQDFPQRPVERRSRSGCNRFCFPQRSDLQEHVARIDARMVVRQQIESNRRHFRQALIQAWRMAAAGMSSQCPDQTVASSSQVAEIKKIAGFAIFAPIGRSIGIWVDCANGACILADI